MSKFLKSAAVALALTMGMGATVSQAAAPAVKLLEADLVNPSTAWSSFYGTSMTHTAGVAAWTARPPEIKKLARALGAGRYTNDEYATRVLDYVRKNINTEFRFGLGKGARGAVLDQSGTSFDQAHLMVELLREGGLSASYQLGSITLDASEFGKWTGLVKDLNESAQTFTVNAKAACRLLADGGIPATVNSASSCASVSGNLSTVTLMHVWVLANSKAYDPGYKQNTLKAGIDIPDAMNCGTEASPTCGSSINTAGLTGATQGTYYGASYIQNVNKTSIDSTLNTFAQNLETEIESIDRTAQLEDIIGGKEVDLEYAPAITTSIPNQAGTFTSWSGDIPNQYRTTLTVEFFNLSQLFYTDEIFGKRLRVITKGPVDTWVRTNYLYVEDEQVATTTYNTGGAVADIVDLTMNHPYVASTGAYGDRTINAYAGKDWRNSQWEYVLTEGEFTEIQTGAWINDISVAWSLGDTGPGQAKLMGDLQGNTADQNLYNNILITHSNHMNHITTAAELLVQMTAAKKLIDGAGKVDLTHHHSMGVVYAVHMRNSVSGFINIESTLSGASTINSDNDRQAAFSTFALSSVALEGSVFQQSEDGWENLSVPALIREANEDGQKFLVVDSSNLSGLLPYIPTYSDRASKLQEFVSTNNYTLVLPDTAEPSVENLSGGTFDWNSSGMFAYKTGHQSYTVNQTLKGSAGVKSLDPYEGILKSVNAAEYSKLEDYYKVDIADGSVTITPPADLEVGSGPSLMKFQRKYVSGEHHKSFCNVIPGSSYTFSLDCLTAGQRGGFHAQLGGGWHHNYEISAEWANSGLEAMGVTKAVRAAKSIAILYSTFDLARSPNLSKRLTGMLLADTMTAAFMKNSINIHLPDQSLVFMRKVAGSYDAPLAAPSAQVTTNSSRNGPYILGGSVVYDYSSTTIQYKGAQGDIINFSWDTQSIVQNGVTYYRARPTFSATNWLQPDGSSITFTYDTETNESTGVVKKVLSRVANNFGRYLDFATLDGYPGMKIQSVTDDQNRQITFNRTCSGSLQWISWNRLRTDACDSYTFTSVDNNVTTYSYVADSASPDPTGAVVPTKRLRKWFSPTNGTTPLLTLKYDETMDVAGLVNRNGTETELFSSSAANENYILGETENALGEIATSYFDEYGNSIKDIDPLGKVTTHAYNSAHRLIETVYPEGNSVQISYDVRGNVTEERKIAKPSTGFSDIVTTTAYYTPSTTATCTDLKRCNKPTSTTDANGNVTSYTYNAYGQLLTMTGPAVSGGSALTTYGYTTTSGISFLVSKTEKIDASNSVVTTYDYDTLANHFNLTDVTVDDGGLDLNISITYDAVGNVETVTDPNGTVTTYDFDEVRRLTTVISPDPDGAGALLPLVTVNKYNDDDQLTGIDKRQGTVGGTLLSRSEADYTAAGQVDKTYGPECFAANGTRNTGLAGCDVTDMDYDLAGRPTLVTDGEGRKTRTIYCTEGIAGCAYGKTYRIQKAYGTALQQNYATYTYTDNGQEATVTDAKGNKTTYEYDGHDRLSKFILPHKTSVGTSDVTDYEEYVYDNNGNMLGKRTRAGDWVRYAYDAMNRMTQKYQQSGGAYAALSSTSCVANNQSFCYSYDLLGRQTLVKFGSGDHPISHSYDKASRLTATNDNGRTITYQYDDAGNRTRVTWPDGFYATYDYDAMNRVEAISDSSGVTLATYDYDDEGRRATLTHHDGSTVSYAYYADNALETLTQNMSGTANDVTWGYGFNAVNQVTSKSISNDLYQWVGIKRDHDYTTNGLNQYTKVRGNSISYDDNGNLTTDGVWHYEYDVENMLVAASRPGMSASFLYDPLGRRSVKTADGATTTFLHDGVEEIADYEGSTLVRRYVHGPGVDEYLVMYDGAGTSNRYFYHANHQGSIVAMTDDSDAASTAGQTGALSQKYTYSPYGMSEDDSTGNPFRYTGRRLDPETGLYYYRARYYSPSIGRFLQTDPIGYGDGLNWYAYVGNDPMSGTDPSGTLCSRGFCYGYGSAFFEAGENEGGSDENKEYYEENKPNYFQWLFESFFTVHANPVHLVLEDLYAPDGNETEGNLGARMRKILEAGAYPDGQRPTLREAMWLWKNGNGKAISVDGSLYEPLAGTDMVGPDIYDDLRVMGREEYPYVVSTYDFKPTRASMEGKKGLDKVKILMRNILNNIAIKEHGQGTPFNWEFR